MDSYIQGILREATSYLPQDVDDTKRLTLVLYSFFKESGIQRKESVAILTLLDESEMLSVFNQILYFMVKNEDRLPSEQDIMEILWPLLKSKDDLEDGIENYENLRMGE